MTLSGCSRRDSICQLCLLAKTIENCFLGLCKTVLYLPSKNQPPNPNNFLAARITIQNTVYQIPITGKQKNKQNQDSILGRKAKVQLISANNGPLSPNWSSALRPNRHRYTRGTRAAAARSLYSRTPDCRTPLSSNPASSFLITIATISRPSKAASGCPH